MKTRLLMAVMFLVLATMVYAAGNAVQFDGVDSYVQYTSSLGISNQYTVEGWIYPTNLTGPPDIPTFGRTIFSSSDVSGSYPLWVTLLGTQLLVRTWTTNTTHLTISAGLTVNTWYHIAVSAVKGGQTVVYVNVSPIGTYSSGTTTTWPATFTVGAIRPSRPTSNLPFAGLIDEVRVWNTIRTPMEIASNYLVPVSPSSAGLVGYWPYDEVSGLTAYDQAGTAQNGTLGNGAFFTASDLTLPVELSSFTSTITANNFVVLQWISQSETNLAGYYVYRNETNDLSNALRISPMIEATNTSIQTNYTFEDDEVVPGVWYYWLQSVDFDGTDDTFGPVMVSLTDPGSGEIPGIPVVTRIHSVYPNPFNPSTTLRYSVSNEQSVMITIFNSRGQQVRSFDEGVRASGEYSLAWDGRNAQGVECNSGVYIFRMISGDGQYTARAILIK